MRNTLSILLLFFLCIQLEAQSTVTPIKKIIHASRIIENLKIDGKLDERVWSSTPTATDFTQLKPNPGAGSTYPTEVSILYDDHAIYFGARMTEPNPDSLAQQLFERDQMDDDIQSDWFVIGIDAYMDGINGVFFFISPSGAQMDIKMTALGDDNSWDAVWSSGVSFFDGGWCAEMRIPYSALRFPDQDIQRWHIQFGRSRFFAQEEAFWNEVSPNENGFFNQSGILEGIESIKSPLRLSATPFLSFYVENLYDKNEDPSSNWGTTINGGMDIKYGISDAFTLDMTLIPDFGQVQSDDEVLNLSPFEIKFDENRQFFTEGTEYLIRPIFFIRGELVANRSTGMMWIPY